MLDIEKLPQAIEAILLAAGRSLSLSKLQKVFEQEAAPPSIDEIQAALEDLKVACQPRGFDLKEVASGFRYQVKSEFSPLVSKLWEEKPPRYSKALLETLALVAYRQPITRGEIEEIRGVSISSSIFKTLYEEREWIRVVGHKEVPGRPGLYATTKEFLDYFGLKNLKELPSLLEIMTLENVEEKKLEPNKKTVQLDLALSKFEVKEERIILKTNE